MRWKAGLALGICLLCLQCSKAGHAQASPEEQDAAAALLLYVNAARVANGLPPYALNPLLTQAAQAHSEYQRDIAHWSHEGADDTYAIDRVRDLGYPAIRVNENVYASSIAGPQEVVDWWLEIDEAHRDNVLHPSLREVGFGTAADADGVVYYTMNISAQPNVLPVFINNDALSTSRPTVTLTLTNEEIFSSGADQIGWATQVLISNSPDFAGAAPRPWAQIIPWALDTADGSGVKTVYVRFIDEAGRIADSQDSIILEAIAAASPTAASSRTATPTLLPPPPTYTAISPPLSPAASPVSPSLQPIITPAAIDSTQPAPLAATLPPTTPVQPSSHAAAPPAQMLFVVILGLGISTLLVGIYLLVRPAR